MEDLYERHGLWSADGTWARLLQQVQGRGRRLVDPPPVRTRDWPRGVATGCDLLGCWPMDVDLETLAWHARSKGGLHLRTVKVLLEHGQLEVVIRAAVERGEWVCA